jgi:hypothetical protein
VVVVDPALREQLPVRSLFDDPSVVDDQDPTGVADRAQAVGDDEARPSLHEGQERRLDAHLGPGVDAADRLVEDEDRGVREDGAGDGQELPLPLAQITGAFHEGCLVAARQLPEEGVGAGGPCRCDAFLVGGGQPSVTDVLQDGAREEEGLLQNDPLPPVLVCLSEGADVLRAFTLPY